MIRAPLLWGLVIILSIALAIQFAQWQGVRETEKDLVGVETAHIRAEHQKWVKRVSDAEKKRERLENQLLWNVPDQLLPALGKVADELSLSLVGVEELRERYRGGYHSLPLQLTFSGDYAGFSELLAVVEQMKPMVRIDESRIYQRKRQKEGLWMSLTLSLMDRINVSTGAGIETPVALKSNLIRTIDRFSVKRYPFRFDKITGTSSLQPNRDQSRSKKAPLPQLSGILWDDENPIAILSNGRKSQLMGVGDVIEGTTLISIQPQRVIVKRGKERYELKVWEKGKGVELK